ncbi:Asr1405/Asl0597 family protein [Nostoc sp. PA-18-2419]|uniref:Asr1405/Asl0597 family protein n=1 Tax=Nostoc sp. PA-18-2419 TaxID=2575443 RepID=UPI00110943AB|nr:Asr1405/Asl0597 family protein [Nostoc sp. PA-18-2419]
MTNNTLDDQVLQIPLSDRWRIYYRLQELKIKSSCLPDGSLRVQVNNLLEAILIRSTVMQFLASRHELIDWLERCWYYSDEC